MEGKLKCYNGSVSLLPHVVLRLYSPLGPSPKVSPCGLSNWVLDFLHGSSSFPKVQKWRQPELLQGQHDFHHILLVKLSQVRFIVIDCGRGPHKGMNFRRHGSWKPSLQTDYHRINEKDRMHGTEPLVSRTWSHLMQVLHGWPLKDMKSTTAFGI